MQDVTLQVSEAINLVNQCLDQTLPFMIIEGEVASFKVNQNKFVFFDIKDSAGSMGCFMMVFQLKFPLEDGMKVRVVAQPKLTQWGKFSLTVKEVMPVGEGSLKKSFEILKAQLEKEGLFDRSRKRQLPKIPQHIGVVSSSGAAGYADFIKILENRWAGLNITLADVPVQGFDAPLEIVGAINYLNELSDPADVIAIIRGGGSADDLSAFNHEDVVRAIALSRTPTIVGVGHETDVGLSDLAADVRAATPSNAAEIIVPDKNEIQRRIMRLSEMAENGVTACIRVFQEDLSSVELSITKTLNTYFVQTQHRLDAYGQTINYINPEMVLKRGYSIVKDGDTVVSKAADAILKDELTMQFSDGEIEVRVKHDIK